MRRFNDREPFGQHLLAATPLLILMTAASVLLQSYGLYGPLERFVIDVFAAADAGRPANHTFIFDIDDESYARSFNRTSPLDQARLADLIRAAFRADARVVAVDVETSVAEVLAKLEPAVAGRIVWARVPDIAEGTTCVKLPKAAPLRDDEGIALMPMDGDGTVRRYRPLFQVANEDANASEASCSDRLVPSFPRAAVRAARIDGIADAAEPLLLNWSGDRLSIPRIPAHQVLADWQEDWWSEVQPVAGRVVLIGGTFKEARDVRRTPAGQMTGVEIMAQMIEADMRGGALAEFGAVGAVVLDVIVGIALLWINWRFPAETRTGFALNAIVVLALPFAAAWLLHRYAMYWINMGPVLAGVWTSQWHDRAKQLASRR
jgi:CHASE2 domain-containing sensor protein